MGSQLLQNTEIIKQSGKSEEYLDLSGIYLAVPKLFFLINENT